MRKKLKKIEIGLILTVVALLAILACNGDPLNSSRLHNYRLDGVVIVDHNSQERISTAHLWRNDSLFTEAALFSDTTLLPYMSNMYYGTNSSASSLLGGDFNFAIIDSSNSFELTVTMPDTFAILTVEPPNRQLQGAGPVTISWSPSVNTDGYIIAAVKATAAYSGSGYSGYPADGGTAGTIPTTAFMIPGTPNPDTGLYNIYVYSVAGAPDSALAWNLLPTPLPTQIEDNIDLSKLTGRIGSVQVLRRDTVRVVTLP